MHADQVSLNGAAVALDDSNIAWKTDINKRFPSANASHFNTVPELRGGNSISGSIKVYCPGGTGSVRAIQEACLSDFMGCASQQERRSDDIMPSLAPGRRHEKALSSALQSLQPSVVQHLCA